MSDSDEVKMDLGVKGAEKDRLNSLKSASFLSLVPYCVIQEILMPVLKEAEMVVITELLVKNAHARQWERTRGYTLYLNPDSHAGYKSYIDDFYETEMRYGRSRAEIAMSLVNDEELVKRETNRLERIYDWLWRIHM